MINKATKNVIILTATIITSLLSSLTPVNSKEIVEEVTWDFYLISGKSIKAIEKELDNKGPDKYWGEMRWEAEITQPCEISVKYNITIPKLVGSFSLSSEDRKQVLDMIENLTEHELQHVEIVRKGLNEIATSKCSNSKTILERIGVENRKFDLDTNHGRNE
jgi:predicted secreted Zn-dependent protease